MDENQLNKDDLLKSENADEVDSNSSSKTKRKNNEDGDQKMEYSTPRKSLRNRTISTKVRTNNNSGRGHLKSKSRRAILKRNPPTKFVPERRKMELENKLFCEGIMYNIGDIVSFEDMNGGIYYAQIRYLFTTSNSDKLCVVTWLVPRDAECDSDSFNPSKFILGYEEDELRHLSFCNFVSRCPSDYFTPLDAPYEVENFPLLNSVNRSFYLDQ